MSNPTIKRGGANCPPPQAGGFRFVPEPRGYWFGDRRLISVTEAIGLAGLVDYSRVAPDVLAHAAERGRAVHLACQLYDEGDLADGSVHPEIAPYLEAWKRFRADVAMEWSQVETPRYHAPLGLAGTPDRVRADGKIILDIKTFSPPSATGVQLAGYSLLEFGPLSSAGETQRIGVWLKDDGQYRVKEFTDRGDEAVFLAALTVAKFKRSQK